MIQHLIIEGHDSWVLAELWKKHLPNPKGYPTEKELKDKKFFKPANGYDKMPSLVSVVLKTEGLTNLGIIIDANDVGVGGRWDAIKNRLSEKFGRDVLANFSPKPGGVVIRKEDLPLTVGVWIMPDNQSNGYLEHFLESMLPSEGKAELWDYIGTTLKDLQSQKGSEQKYAYLARLAKEGFRYSVVQRLFQS